MSCVLHRVLAFGFATFTISVAAGAADRAADVSNDAGLDPDPTFQMNTTVQGQLYSYDNVGYPNASGSGEGANTSLVEFLTPLRDDGAPYTLRPFLQRTSMFSLAVSGFHWDTHRPSNGTDRTEWTGGFGPGFDVYLKPWLAIFGGLGYSYDVLHDVDVDQHTHEVSGNAGIGLRSHDTRFDLSYAQDVRIVDGTLASPRRGAVELSVSTVVRRRFEADASGTLIVGGQQGSLSLEDFLIPSVGVFIDGFASHGELYSGTTVVVTRFVGGVGAALWFDANTELVGEYDLTDERAAAQTIGSLSYDYRELAHNVLLEVNLRI